MSHLKLKKKKEYFDPRSYYPWKLVLANARSGKRRGSRAEPTTTHPHSSIKHKCHLPMPDPHELRLLPRLLAPRRRVSFPIPRLPLLLYFSIGSISVPWRSISPRGDSRKKTKSWQNSAAGWSIFRNPRNLHARENWWNKTVKPRNGILANLWTLHLLTDSYIYTHIFFLERRLNILDPGYSVTTILSTEKYNRDIEKNIIFSSREFVRKV